ncbi:MAG: DUF721 domain-containing protein [Nitrospirales bacterium]
MPAFSSLKSLIPHFAKSYGFDIKLLESHLQKAWPDIVGAGLASHTRPDSIKFRKLFLLAENSAWLQQLVFLKPMILEKLNEFAKDVEITDIVLRIGDIHPTQSSTQMTPPPTSFAVVPMTSALELASTWTAEIKEPKLRAVLVDVIAKGLSLGKQPSRL